MYSSLDHLIDLAKKTGDNLIIHDPIEGRDVVIMDVEKYEDLISQKQCQCEHDDSELHEEEGNWHQASDIIKDRYDLPVSGEEDFSVVKDLSDGIEDDDEDFESDFDQAGFFKNFNFEETKPPYTNSDFAATSVVEEVPENEGEDITFNFDRKENEEPETEEIKVEDIPFDVPMPGSEAAEIPYSSEVLGEAEWEEEPLSDEEPVFLEEPV